MTTASAFWRGTRNGAPFVLVMVPFAILFGVVATEAGLSVVQTMGFTVFVVAGASQFAALQLMTENAPTLVVVVSALAVNLRMAVYSAGLVPYLGAAPLWQRALVAYLCVDQSYVCAVADYENRPRDQIRERVAYFAGVTWVVIPSWYVGTLVGALAGQAIPPEWALDFAVPICFLAIIAPGLRTLPHVVAALVSCVGVLGLVWVPYNLGLVCSAVLAMMAGSACELWQKARRA